MDHRGHSAIWKNLQDSLVFAGRYKSGTAVDGRSG
jgi:hypothetical protein